MFDRVVIFGGSGAIGSAIAEVVSENHPKAEIILISRSLPQKYKNNFKYFDIDFNQEDSLEKAASKFSINNPIDSIFVATGILHNERIFPERSLKELSGTNFIETFKINSVIPALIAKYFVPKLNKKKKVLFSALSARVGSISDNSIGGWYSYRASKAALNMIIKNISIELKRINKDSIVVGLHPGSVKSYLSEPFQSRIRKDKLFLPNFSANKLLSVVSKLSPEDSGKCFAWDGKEIIP